MGYIEVDALAKINLSLDVLNKRGDGYHQLRMIMQTVELHDTVHIESTDMGIRVTCDNSNVPSGMENIAAKAALLITGQYSIKTGLRIHIEKRIPIAAGLAGGSTDAAAVLRGINELFSMDLTAAELNILAKRVGADVPYCVKGGTMLAEGIGEILKPINPQFSGYEMVLLKPKIDVSTAWVYENLNIGSINERPDTDMLLTAIKEGNLNKLSANMKNVLETVTIPNYPIVQRAKDRLMELGALGSMMSGSGPSVFGFFASREAAAKAYDAILDKRWDSYLTRTRKGLVLEYGNN